MLHLPRFQKAPVRIALGLGWAVLFSAVSSQAQEYRVGMSFDTEAQSCVGEIRNFGQDVRLHIFAFVPPGTEVNGALLSLQLPPGIFLRNRIDPKDVSVMPEALTAITSDSGVDLTFQRCPVASGPVLLVSYDIYQSDDCCVGGARVPDLALWLGGGVMEADSLKFERPQVKICDPDDPIGGTPELVEAASLRAMLNCSSDCPCVTGVVRKTWGWVKRQFGEP